MKRLSLLLLLGLLPVVVLMADPVDKDAARLKAEAFFMKKNPSSARRAQVRQDISLALTNESFHVFNLGEDGGFVMIAGDDCAPDILGYSDCGTFDAENMPENLREWLDGYAEQIAWMKENGASPDPSQGGENGGSSRSAANSWGSRPAIEPLLTSKWHQHDPYNRQTPTEDGKHCVTGCVATSMAQVMHYWYKKIGYETRLCKSITFKAENYSPTTFDWANIKDFYWSYNEIEANAVAKLMKYCGYSVGMRYGLDESKANQQDARKALTYNFGFRCARFIERSDFKNQEWMENIYTDLANGRPVIMAGKDTGGNEGHSFVCDGYDKEDFFHFNWGWGGDDNGYYRLCFLNPPGYTFTIDQRAICCIHPTEVISLPVNPSYPNHKISNYLFASDINIPVLYSGEEQEVSMTITNYGDVYSGMIIFEALVYQSIEKQRLLGQEVFGSNIFIEPGESKRVTIPVKLSPRSKIRWAKINISCYDGLNNKSLYSPKEKVQILSSLPNLNGSVQIRETVAEPEEALTLKLTGEANNTDVSMRHRQWQISPDGTSDWTDIPGATGTQYYPTMDQVGQYLRIVVKVDGYRGKMVSDSRKVTTPTLKGTVTITRNNAPHPGATLYYHLEGKVADIDPSLIEVRWDYQTDPSKVLWHILSEGNNSYTLETSDLGKYFRVIIKAKGYESGLISDYILCRKDECRKEVVAPELSISTAYNQVQVTNPQVGQEYIIMNSKKAIDKLTEDDWEDSQTFGPSDNFLFMGGSPNRTFYVYTRVKETETTLAGTDVRMASIYFGENVYLQDIKIEAKKYNGSGSFVSLGESEWGEYYLKLNDILRLEAKPIPSNATNYNGIYYDNWSASYGGDYNGTFYSDEQCTKTLESGKHYKVVYYKPGRPQNRVCIMAQFTKGYNDMAVDYFYVNVADMQGYWSANSLRAEVNVSKGKISQNEEFTTYPSKATIYGYRLELKNKTGEVPPDVAFHVLNRTVYVDATNASVGDYWFDVYQYDVKLDNGVTIHVTTPTPEEIRILPEEFTLDCGEPLQLEAQLFPEGAEGEVTWSSSNTSVATVTSDGLVTFKDGADIGATAIITATVGELSASCELTVAGEEYPIYIAGKQVTSRNMDDLAAVVDEVNGASGRRKTSATDVPTMYFDGEVLWLKNITINTGNSGIPGIVIDQPGVKVIVEGECGISSYSGIGLKIAKDTKIYGDGKLSITSNDAAIMLESEEGDKHINLEVNDIELSLFATNLAIKGSENDRCSLTLNNVTGWWQGNTGIVAGLQGGLEMNSCHFVEPEGLEMISGSVFDGEALATYAALDHLTTLYEEFDNTPLIEQMYDEVDFAALGHYRLSHDCKWQTLCLPFNVYSFAGTPFEDATVMTLDTEGKNGFDEETGTLYLTFKSVTTTEAGKPYIVGFTSGDDCYQPILRAYFRSKTPQSVSAASEGLAEVKMVGTFTPVSFEEDYSGTFFIDGANDLYAATEWSYLNSFRAYFDVPSLHGGTATVKQIVVDFADAPDGIERISEFSEFSEHSEFSEKAPAFFDLSGRKMVNDQWSNGKLKKGIYITGGKKVVIK